MSWALNAGVNEGLIVTYSSPLQLESTLRYDAEKNSSLIKCGIEYLNKVFYNDNIRRYYKFDVNNKELLKAPKKMIISVILKALKENVLHVILKYKIELILVVIIIITATLLLTAVL